MRKLRITPLFTLTICTLGLLLFIFLTKSKASKQSIVKVETSKDVQQIVVLVWESFSSRLIPSVTY